MKYKLSDSVEKQDAILKFKKFLDEGASIELKKNSKRRSLSQNGYMHVCIKFFAIEYGYRMDEAKFELKKLCPFMRYEHVNKKGKKTVQFKQTAIMDSAEITKFIDWIRTFCSKEGCYIPTAEEFKERRDKYENVFESHSDHL